MHIRGDKAAECLVWSLSHGLRPHLFLESLFPSAGISGTLSARLALINCQPQPAAVSAIRDSVPIKIHVRIFFLFRDCSAMLSAALIDAGPSDRVVST